MKKLLFAILVLSAQSVSAKTLEYSCTNVKEGKEAVLEIKNGIFSSSIDFDGSEFPFEGKTLTTELREMKPGKYVMSLAGEGIGGFLFGGDNALILDSRLYEGVKSAQVAEAYWKSNGEISIDSIYNCKIR